MDEIKKLKEKNKKQLEKIKELKRKNARTDRDFVRVANRYKDVKEQRDTHSQRLDNARSKCDELINENLDFLAEIQDLKDSIVGLVKKLK